MAAAEKLAKKLKGDKNITAIGHDNVQIIVHAKKPGDYPKTCQGYKVMVISNPKPISKRKLQKETDEIHQHTVTIDKEKFDKALQETIKGVVKDVKNPEYYGIEVQFNEKGRYIRLNDIPENIRPRLKKFVEEQSKIIDGQVQLSDWITYNVLHPQGDDD